MSVKEPIIADLTRLETISPILSGVPIPIKQFAQWEGIILSSFDFAPCEFQEHQWKQHLLGISAVGTPTKAEHRLDGQLHQHSYQSYEMTMIPAHSSYWGFWEAHEFLALGIEPSLSRENCARIGQINPG